MRDPKIIRVGPWYFRVDNYRDWEPGYQIHLEDGLKGVLDVDKTFKTVQNVEMYIRVTLKELAQELIREL